MEQYLKYFVERTTTKKLIEILGRSRTISILNLMRRDNWIRIVGDEWELTEFGHAEWLRYCGVKS